MSKFAKASEAYHRLRDVALRPEPIYRLVAGRRLTQFPVRRPMNDVLRSKEEWVAAQHEAAELGLPLHGDGPKNWDVLTALSLILQRTNQNARILDAGAELYSTLLPSLYCYGYRELFGINLCFRRPTRRGPIRYVPGDLTATEFSDASFDAIACLSVIEHGVPPAAYFSEMARLLKPGGLLVTSTDYWPEPVDTAGKVAYGAPVRIYSKSNVEEAVEVACNHGFRLSDPLELHCTEKTVRWDRMNLDFTFVVFTLQRCA